MTDHHNIVIEQDGINWTPPFAVPMARDFLGRPIANPVPCKPASPFDDPATDAWIEANKEAKMDSPLAAPTSTPVNLGGTGGPIGRTLDSGRPTITQRVLSVNLTSSKWRAGIGVFSVVTRDDNGSHTLEFKEFDVLLRQAVEDLQPMERGKAYKVDFDIAWRHEDGWPTVKSYKENEVKTIAEAMKTVEQEVAEAHAEHVANRPETEFDNFDKPAAVGEEQEYVDFAKHAAWIDNDKARGKFFGDYTKLCNKYVVDEEKREPIRKATLTRLCGYDTLKGYLGEAKELLRELEFDIKAAGFKPVNQDVPENSPNEAAGETIAKSEPTPQEKPATPIAPEIPRSEPTNIIPFAKLPVTLTGISVIDIPKRLNEHLPPQAYGSIKFGQMSGKTDVDGDYVRDRFDEVFGPMGVGWRIGPNPYAGRVEYKSEIRKNKDGKDQTWHIVTLVAHTFQYAVVSPDGAMTWVEASTTSDQHDNLDEQYAYRGALTSLMKQIYKLMGGMNHVLRNEYTHVHAERELRRAG